MLLNDVALLAERGDRRRGKRKQPSAGTSVGIPALSGGNEESHAKPWKDIAYEAGIRNGLL